MGGGWEGRVRGGGRDGREESGREREWGEEDGRGGGMEGERERGLSAYDSDVTHLNTACRSAIVPGMVEPNRSRPAACRKLRRHHWHVPSHTASGKMGSYHPVG